MSKQLDGITKAMYKLFEEGETPEQVASELEITLKDVHDIYVGWKQSKMDKLSEGDKVCYVLNMSGYKKHLVYGNILLKKENSVVVESKENEYIEDVLNGKVAVSVKDILKVG